MMPLMGKRLVMAAPYDCVYSSTPTAREKCFPSKTTTEIIRLLELGHYTVCGHSGIFDLCPRTNL
jgi:hypothetical protein